MSKNSLPKMNPSSEVNNDEAMTPDNYPLVFSGTDSGHLSLLETGARQSGQQNKKELISDHSQKEISNKSSGERHDPRQISHQFNSGALEICHGTSNPSGNRSSVPPIQSGSRTGEASSTQQQFQFFSGTAAGIDFNYSVEQADIKLNQPDSLALSDNFQSHQSMQKQHLFQFSHQTGGHEALSYDEREGEMSAKNMNLPKKPQTPQEKQHSGNSQNIRSQSQNQSGKGSARFGRTKSRSSRQQSQTSFLNRSLTQQQGEHDKKNSEQYEGGSFQSCGEESSSMSAFKLTTMGRFDELNMLCKEYNLSYINITNEQGNNLIIKAVQNKDIEGIKVLLAAARAQLSGQGLSAKEVDLKIKDWVNSKSNSGYSAAHFSCYVGDPDILILLLTEGADFLQLNNEGSNGLHVAAQNDAITSIVFLLLLGIDINSKDLKDATPLHWASFQGLDQSVLFLLSYGASVNERDSEGMTPLILSAISGSIRIVRMLLLAGADRMITDNKNRTALFMVEEDPDNINEDVAEMLKRTSGFQEYWNIRPVFKPTKKSPEQVLWYFGMYIFTHASFIFFNQTLWGNDTSPIIIGLLVALAVCTNLSFIVSWLRDPGYVRHSAVAKKQQFLRNQNLENLINSVVPSSDELGERAALAQPPLSQEQRTKLFHLFELLRVENDSSKICAHCSIFKPKRSRHCDICKECVSVYDHHCPWVNNCVGTRNHMFFLVFIICVWLTIIIMSLFNILYSWRSDYPDNSYIDCIGFIPSSFKVGFMVLKIICAGTTVFFGFLFGVPLTLLIIVQLGNFRKNCTTFERFSQHSKDNILRAQQESNISQAGHHDENQLTSSLIPSEQSVSSSSIANCSDMCLRNQRNSNYLFKNEF